MAKKKRKDTGAVSMAKKRWKKVSAEERSRLMTAAINARWERYRNREEAAKTEAVA